MKKLILIRHAKSSWADAGQTDAERPLNARGLSDAPIMGRRLIEKGIQPDAFICSTAVRTRQTCALMMQTYGLDPASMMLSSKLYLAEPEAFREVIKAIDPSFNQVVIVSHNNGITEFANQLTKVQVDEMPTCSVFAITVQTNEWKDFDKAAKAFLFFDYPKLSGHQ